MDGRSFEVVAAGVMSTHFGVALGPRKVAGTPKRFDLVSSDGSIVGDAKYYTMVRGVSPPPAKRSVIAEYVWLLEHTKAEQRFLVFGNDRRVPEGWLKDYGHLLNGIDFYFIDVQGTLFTLK